MLRTILGPGVIATYNKVFKEFVFWNCVNFVVCKVEVKKKKNILS